MTSGWRVLCSDGNSRHSELFPTRRDALTWQTFRHICPFGHRVRKEAEWPVESIRLRPPSFPSARSSLGSTSDCIRAEGSNVGTGVSPSLAGFVAPEPPIHPAPVPASFEGSR